MVIQLWSKIVKNILNLVLFISGYVELIDLHHGDSACQIPQRNLGGGGGYLYTTSTTSVYHWCSLYWLGIFLYHHPHHSLPSLKFPHLVPLLVGPDRHHWHTLQLAAFLKLKLRFFIAVTRLLFAAPLGKVNQYNAALRVFRRTSLWCGTDTDSAIASLANPKKSLSWKKKPYRTNVGNQLMFVYIRNHRKLSLAKRDLRDVTIFILKRFPTQFGEWNV